MKLKAIAGALILICAIVGCRKHHDDGPPPPPPQADTLMNWKKSPAVFAHPILDIWFTDAAHGIVCADDSSLYRSQDSGKTWQKTFSQKKNFINLYFLNGQQGYAIGDSLATTFDGGQTWSFMNAAPIGSSGHDVRFVSPAIGYIIAEPGVFKTIDSGHTWKKMLGEWCYALYFLNKDTGFVYSNSGRIAKTTNGGTSWQTAAPVPSSAHVSVFEFTDANHGWFSTYNTLYITTDGWASSRQVQVSSDDIRDIQFFDNLNGYVLTAHEIYKTTDGGNTWTRHCKLGSSGPAGLIEFYFLNSNTGWAAGDVVLRLNQ